MYPWCKVVETELGTILFYIEPDGDSYFVHRILNIKDMGQVDSKLTITLKDDVTEEEFYTKAYSTFTVKTALDTINELNNMLGITNEG